MTAFFMLLDIIVPVSFAGSGVSLFYLSFF